MNGLETLKLLNFNLKKYKKTKKSLAILSHIIYT